MTDGTDRIRDLVQRLRREIPLPKRGLEKRTLMAEAADLLAKIADPTTQMSTVGKHVLKGSMAGDPWYEREAAESVFRAMAATASLSE